MSGDRSSAAWSCLGYRRVQRGSLRPGGRIHDARLRDRRSADRRPVSTTPSIRRRSQCSWQPPAATQANSSRRASPAPTRRGGRPLLRSRTSRPDWRTPTPTRSPASRQLNRAVDTRRRSRQPQRRGDRPVGSIHLQSVIAPTRRAGRRVDPPTATPSAQRRHVQRAAPPQPSRSCC